jgi:hypothetical protein
MNVKIAAPPHGPKTGWARRMLGDFHVTGLFWYRLHRWAIATLPEWTLGIWITLCQTALKSFQERSSKSFQMSGVVMGFPRLFSAA